MGNQYAPSFKAQYEGAYPDKELQRFCEKIVLDMAKASHRPSLPWNFTILNSSEVNAFALPGGTVCITRGLLHQLKNEAAFAGVMGHEVGHVTHKHAAQGMGRSTIFNLILAGAAVGVSQATDSEWAQLGLALGATGGQLYLLTFSRDQETQADRRGVDYSYKVGYDPRELGSVFELFKKLKGGQSQPVWLSTHPLDDDRIEDVAAYVEEKYPQVVRSNGQGLKVNSPEWDRLMANLRSDQKVYEDYDAANRAFAEAVKSGDPARLAPVLKALESCKARLPGHALFTSAVGVALYSMGQPEKAKGYFQKAASQQTDLFEPHLYLCQIAFENGDASAVHREGELAVRIFPANPLPYFIRARTYDGQGSYSEAAQQYEAVVERANDQSEEYRYSVQRLQAFQARGINW
jgi:predicted Zn-dependent protease